MLPDAFFMAFVWAADVYKRQIYALVGNLKIVLFTVEFNICLEGHTIPSVISQLFNPLTIFTFINRHIAAMSVNSLHQVLVISVSYTHLDVYKRQ